MGWRLGGAQAPAQVTEWVTQGLCKERGQWGTGQKHEVTADDGWPPGGGRLRVSEGVAASAVSLSLS